MELILKNDVGCIISKHKTTQISAAAAIYEETGWILEPGDVIEVHEDEIDEKDIKERLESCVNDIFLAYQKKLNIKSGDISPLQNLKLESEIKTLAERIASVLMEQKGM